MKIVIVNAHISHQIGGSELQCDLIARELIRRGHEVHYVAVGGARMAPPTSYRIYPIEASASGIAKVCLAIRPDIVYWRFNKRNFYSAVKAIAADSIPIVFAISHVADTQKWASKRTISWSAWRDIYRILRDKIYSRWNYRGFKFVSGIVANNADLLNFIPLSPQLHVPNSFSNVAESIDESMPWPTPYCLWVASVKPQKQPEQFVALAERLKTSGIDFLMIGHIQTSGYAYLSDRKGLPRNFHYLGAMDAPAVNRFVDRALFIVHTCRPEGFPNIFIEAWSHSKPVVSLCFDPQGLLYREGIGICSGNFETLVEDATSLIRDLRMREEMGARAKAFADRSFNLERNVQTLEAFLQSFVSPTTPAP